MLFRSVGVGVAAERSQHEAPAAVAAPAPETVDATFGVAAAPRATPAPGGDPVTALLDGTTGATGVAAVGELVARLGRDLAKLPGAAPATLAAAGRGDVRIDVGPAAAGVDLRQDPQACPSFRVLGVGVGCRSPGEPMVVAPADPHAADGEGEGEGEGEAAPAEAIPLADGLQQPGDEPAAP